MKTSDVLVLDCNWQPVGFCTWKRAVRLWYKSRAIILKEDESGRMLRSDGFETGLPRIILVNNCWPKKKRDKVQCNRHTVYIRDNGQCQYCGKKLGKHEFTLDHVVPLCQSGKDEWTNLVLSCKPCNGYKDDMTPEQAGMVLLNKPYTPKADDPRFNLKMRADRFHDEWRDYRQFIYV
jgi:hypothetical protein